MTKTSEQARQGTRILITGAFAPILGEYAPFFLRSARIGMRVRHKCTASTNLSVLLFIPAAQVALPFSSERFDHNSQANLTISAIKAGHALTHQRRL